MVEVDAVLVHLPQGRKVPAALSRESRIIWAALVDFLFGRGEAAPPIVMEQARVRQLRAGVQARAARSSSRLALVQARGPDRHRDALAAQISDSPSTS